MAHGARAAMMASVPSVRACGGGKRPVNGLHNCRVVISHDVPLWFGLACILVALHQASRVIGLLARGQA